MNFSLGGINFGGSYLIAKNITHEGKELLGNINAIGNSYIKLKGCSTFVGSDVIDITSKNGNIEITRSDIKGDVSSKTGKITLISTSIRNIEIKKGALEMEHCHVNGTLSIIGTKTDKMPEASEHNLKIGAHSVINNIHVKNTEYNISSWVTSKFNTPNFIRNIFEMTAEYSRRTDQAESAIPLKSNVTLGANSVLKSITLDKDVSCTLVVPDDARFDGDPGVQGLTVINNGARAAA